MSYFETLVRKSRTYYCATGQGVTSTPVATHPSCDLLPPPSMQPSALPLANIESTGFAAEDIRLNPPAEQLLSKLRYANRAKRAKKPRGAASIIPVAANKTRHTKEPPTNQAKIPRLSSIPSMMSIVTIPPRYAPSLPPLTTDTTKPTSKAVVPRPPWRITNILALVKFDTTRHHLTASYTDVYNHQDWSAVWWCGSGNKNLPIMQQAQMPDRPMTALLAYRSGRERVRQ